MPKQKFHRGNLVHIATNLGAAMSHFMADEDVVIIGSYCDQFHSHAGQVKASTILKYSGHRQFTEPTDPAVQPENCSEPNGHSYTVLFRESGECSWYDEHQLTLVNVGGEHKIVEFSKKKKESVRA